MRRINLKTLRGRLTAELKNLPFEITKNGKVIAMVSDKGLNIPVIKQVKGLNNSGKEDKGLNNSIERVKKQLVEVIKKKKKVVTQKATSSTASTPAVTGQGWINPLVGSALAPKG